MFSLNYSIFSFLIPFRWKPLSFSWGSASRFHSILPAWPQPKGQIEGKERENLIPLEILEIPDEFLFISKGYDSHGFLSEKHWWIQATGATDRYTDSLA